MSKTKNWAILIGINAYRHIGRLNYANRDAEAMREFFYEAKFDRVFCFADELEIPPQSDQQSTQPRSADLVDFLHDRFTTETPPLASSDNCWFFFAGHGKRINDCDYLLPQDYSPRPPNHVDRAISVNFVRESLLKSGAGNVILLLDACRTEDGDRSDSLGIGDQQPGAITIFSCQRNQKAWEIDALQQGAFTAALLEGLRMSGERNCATVKRLDLYLQDRVPELCRLHQKLPEQNPTTITEPSQKSCLILLPQYATAQDIEALKIEAFRAAQFDRNLDLSEQLWKRVNAVSLGQDYDAIRALQDIAVQRMKDLKLSPAVMTQESLEKTSEKDLLGGSVLTNPCSISEQPTSSQRERLERDRNSLHSERILLLRKITQLRQNLVIEADGSVKFHLRKQIQNEEAELIDLEKKLDEIEQALNSDATSSNSQAPSKIAETAQHPDRLNDINMETPLVVKTTSAFGTFLNLSIIPTPDELVSEKDLDYRNLRDLLAAGKWQEADRETDKLMFQIAGLETDEIFPEDKIENFPCVDLRTINQIWLKYSAGQFGFSIQKQIWEESRRNYSEFGKTVGWKVNNKWLLYSQMIFDTTAPQGHLPTGKFECTSSTDWDLSPEYCRSDIPSLFYRVETCQLKGESKSTNDYQDLKNSLVAGDWRTADSKTYVAICRILGIAKTSEATDEVEWQNTTWIGNREIKSFPSSDLQAI